MFDPTAKLVVFVPNATSGSATFTDPSYVMPAFYDVWACFDANNAAFWRTVSATSRAFFPKATHPTTGLAPEYASFDGTPSTTAMKGDFRFDAWRVAINATLGFGLSASAARPFVQALWDLPVPTGTYRYYNGMLYMLSLLHASGKFQLWF
jgi:oligosaccharide reducing-end xylanase